MRASVVGLMVALMAASCATAPTADELRMYRDLALETIHVLEDEGLIDLSGDADGSDEASLRDRLVTVLVDYVETEGTLDDLIDRVLGAVNTAPESGAKGFVPADRAAGARSRLHALYAESPLLE